jgi:hypothetical protein
MILLGRDDEKEFIAIEERLRWCAEERWKDFWRPVRESNPCRRRESEENHCNPMELRGMDSTLPHFEGLTGTPMGPLMDALRMGPGYTPNIQENAPRT